MNKYERYYGIIIFTVVTLVLIALFSNLIGKEALTKKSLEANIAQKESSLKKKQQELSIVQKKIEKIRTSISNSQKKIYSPIETDLGNASLFFTLYNDVIEMVHANSVKINSLEYSHNPETDSFVKFGKDVYFVCDINLDLVSNYVKLGNLIQDLYQYPYYIKINELSIKPYSKDKRILLSKLKLRLYAHTEPENKN